MIVLHTYPVINPLSLAWCALTECQPLLHWVQSCRGQILI